MNPEQQKVEKFLEEIENLLPTNPDLVSSRQFFELWEDTVKPRPFPVSENVISKTHAGIVGDGGRWGGIFLRFLSSDAVSDIYAYHGLLRAD